MDYDTVIVRCDDLLEAEVNGEIVALDVQRGQCYGLDAVASDIWRLLSKPITVGELCSQITTIYDVDEATCRPDVDALLSNFISEGLIQVQSD